METIRDEEDMEQEVGLRCEAGRWVGDRRTCRGKYFRICSPVYGRALVVLFFPVPRSNLKRNLSNKSQLVILH